MRISGIAIPPIDPELIANDIKNLTELQQDMCFIAKYTSMLTIESLTSDHVRTSRCTPLHHCWNCLYEVQNYNTFEKVFNKYWKKS